MFRVIIFGEKIQDASFWLRQENIRRTRTTNAVGEKVSQRLFWKGYNTIDAGMHLLFLEDHILRMGF